MPKTWASSCSLSGYSKAGGQAASSLGIRGAYPSTLFVRSKSIAWLLRATAKGRNQTSVRLSPIVNHRQAQTKAMSAFILPKLVRSGLSRC
jgi:hypothetical protein